MVSVDPFGPLVPEQTSDDTDAGRGDWERDDLERLLGERPPHHDG